MVITISLENLMSGLEGYVDDPVLRWNLLKELIDGLDTPARTSHEAETGQDTDKLESASDEQ